jgi:hypothetical protein
MKTIFRTATIPVLALLAGAIHLAHNYLPEAMPAGGPPAGGPLPNGAPSGIMALVGPHMELAMMLNFIGFAGLAFVFLWAARRLQWSLRSGSDVLLVMLSATTLYAWNAMGRFNQYGLGTAALVVEAGLILLAVSDVAGLAWRRA